MPDKFVLLSTMRSGTTLLVSLLDSHPEVLCGGEMLHPSPARASRVSYHPELTLGAFLQKQPKQRIFWYYKKELVLCNYLDWFYAHSASAQGFKLMYSHLLRYPSVLGYVEKNRIKPIVLVRESSLDWLVSQAVYFLRDQRNLSVFKKIKTHLRKYAFAKKNSREMIEINIRNAVKKIQKYEAEKAELRRLCEYLGGVYVTYEELTSDRSYTMEKLWHCTGVSSFDSVSQEKKAVTRSPDQVIANYTALVGALKNEGLF